RYGESQVRAQIKAARDRGVSEYLLWNASNRYTTAALIPPKPTKSPKKDPAKTAATAKTAPNSASPVPSKAATPAAIATPAAAAPPATKR
ncbi:MAG TPA: putative glycoside hydrolase, partial [Armatimonadaceae bacterium]|nr:putative glycoside hydrolase [Armatimonadaceae bacterium]